MPGMANEAAREGWRLDRPALQRPRIKSGVTNEGKNPTDARELLPGNSNETAGADAPVFFCLL